MASRARRDSKSRLPLAALVRYAFRMGRIRIGLEELAQSITIWLAVAGQKRPALIRDLWTRKSEFSDDAKRNFARRELGRYLAEKVDTSGWEVTRAVTPHDEFTPLAEDAAPDLDRG